MAVVLAAVLGLLATQAAVAHPRPVVVDGRYDDWSDDDAVYARADSGAAGQAPAITRVWARSDGGRLWLRLRLSAEVVLQRDSNVVLHVDTDGDPGTGRPVDGLGADFTWRFGDREGRVLVLDAPIRVLQNNVGLRQAPTYAASEFEVSFDREASVAGGPLFPGSRIALALRMESPGAVHGTTGRLEVTPAGPPTPPPSVTALPGKQTDCLRVLTYNVLFDGVFERPLPFRRILGALDPDVVSFQELYRHSAEETLEWVRRVLPGSPWHAAGFGQGVILSRFPVLAWGPLGTQRRGAWAILDTPDGQLAVVNPHAPCCENDAGRQDEFDALAAWIRDARASGLLGPGTGVVVAGDMNLVGDSRQLTTLLEGAIVDTATHGPAAAPDGDGSPLSDAAPYHLSGTEAYTWRSDTSVFAPGKLDYIVYSDSVLGLAGSFVLWTPELSAQVLDETGLEADDTVVASDHLPVVADVYFRASSSR